MTGSYLTVDGGFLAQGAWATSAGAEDDHGHVGGP